MTPSSENGSAATGRHVQPRSRGQRAADGSGAPNRLPAPLAVLVGVVSAVIGLLPWLISGMRLPLQFIWATDARPEDMPFALLPLSGTYLVATVAMVVVGSALAGTAVRIAARLGRPPRVRLVAVGAAAVQAVALVQASSVVSGGLEESSRAQVYLWGMVAGVCVGIIIGLLVMAGIGRADIASATIAITFAALALTQWLPFLARPIGSGPLYDADIPAIVWETEKWLPFLIVAVAVGWCGVASLKRAAASMVSLASLWIGYAAVIAFNWAVGTRINLQYPSELVSTTSRVFVESLTSFGIPGRMLVTVVLAAMIAVVLNAVRIVRQTNASQDD
ncbi:hypothetical protein ACNI3K_08270 [Demequina sp. SO4-13]|uniref:hypothetical protein n=1 Tax=Demequina sp. SO4-13 TaxID=3401027 RepID=UPI003AF90BF6